MKTALISLRLQALVGVLVLLAGCADLNEGDDVSAVSSSLQFDQPEAELSDGAGEPQAFDATGEPGESIESVDSLSISRLLAAAEDEALRNDGPRVSDAMGEPPPIPWRDGRAAEPCDSSASVPVTNSSNGTGRTQGK